MASEEQPKHILDLLEQVRAIAQTGLHYTESAFDRERYRHLLEVAVAEYARISGLPEGPLLERFRREMGHITPKVAVDAAVSDDGGRLLLVRRFDDGSWCLPGGWADPGETPQQATRREVWEETRVWVTVGPLIDLFVRLPGAYSQPHTSYHLLYSCTQEEGKPSPSLEALEVGFHDHTRIVEWHRDHQQRAERAYRFWLEQHPTQAR